jgi:cytochrome c oxidase assembly protein subunit 15
VPSAASLFFHEPWWRNIFENTLTVQFNHRMMAYAIFIVAFLHLADAWRAADRPDVVGAAVLFFAVMVQAILGIVTLLYQVPLSLALAHQAMAMALLTVAVVHAERLPLPPAGHAQHRAADIGSRIR